MSTSHIDEHLDAAIPISSSALSIDVYTAAVKLNIPLTCLEGIWEKAKQLITTEGASTRTRSTSENGVEL